MQTQFIPNHEKIREKMLEEIGVSSIDELFSDIPQEIRLKKKLNLPPPLSEQEVKNHLRGVLQKNITFGEMPIFLGGGLWPHFIPAAVKSILQRSEFLTAYTPYQPEISQGVLQALFEYQSLMAELVGLDIVNSSMYDWATALGEAALMCARITHKSKFLVPKFIPQSRESVLRNYVLGPGIELVRVSQDGETGQLDLKDLREKLEGAAGVYIENPSYLGFLETQVDEISEMVHREKALFVVGVNPISLGILRPPGDYGADIVVGEGQPLGNPVGFGGPTLGIFACKGGKEFLHQMPGKIVGMTTTVDGKTRGFTMVLQTREQHIRRERATSNICTNETLCALAAAVYLSLLGPSGLREAAETCALNTAYLVKRLKKIDGVDAPVFRAPHFNEFVLRCEKSIAELNRRLLEKGVHGGKPLKEEFPELGEAALISTTEIHRKSDLDKFIDATKTTLEEMK